MAVIRKSDVTPNTGSAARVAALGRFAALRYSDAGGLTQFGALVETLPPGSRSSDRHWHEAEDEFLYMLEGRATVIEDEGGAQDIGPGDACCWKAGVADGHQVINRSDAPCTYLVVGTRAARDQVHYSEIDKIQIRDNGTRRWTRRDGTPLEVPA